MRSLVIGPALALAVSAPALAARQVITPSGKPDAVFLGSNMQDASSKIASHCMDKGWMVTSQTTNQIVCDVPQSMMATVFQQLAIGNSYSTTPKTYIRVSLAQIGNSTRAQAMMWTETQMAFGQINRMEYTADNQIDGMQGFLIESGGTLPAGTTFPGIFMGMDGQPEVSGKVVFIPVTKVTPGTPAAEAGMQVGDRILKINGKAFKDLKSMKALLNKIGVGVRYPVTISRNGVESTIMLEARQRPAVGTPEYDVIMAANAQPAAVAAPAPIVDVTLKTPG